jgi:hypothetical protein
MAQLELLIRQVETGLWTGGLLSSSASAVAMRHSIISSRPFNDGHGLETLTPIQLRLQKELQPGHQLRLCAYCTFSCRRPEHRGHSRSRIAQIIDVSSRKGLFLKSIIRPGGD